MTQQIYKDHNGLAVYALSPGNPTLSGHVVELGSDGHYYEVIDTSVDGMYGTTVSFQEGPVPSNGINGLTNETVLSILIHRTTILNSKFGSADNLEAIAAMQQALAALERRTKNRQLRGVEGKLES